MENKDIKDLCERTLQGLVVGLDMIDSNDQELAYYQSIIGVVHSILMDGGAEGLDQILKLGFSEYYGIECPIPILIFEN